MNYAEATCVLKINIHCQACKSKIAGVLNSICGLYNVDIDAEQGMIRVSGLVDPEMLTGALMKTGYHAELKWVNLHHPTLRRYNGYGVGEDYDLYNYGCERGYNYGYRGIEEPYNYGYGRGYNYGYGGIEERYNYRPWNNYATMPGNGLGYPYYHNGFLQPY